MQGIAALLILLSAWPGLSRQESQSVYWEREAALELLPHWNGTLSGCSAATTSAAYRDATLNLVNAYRRLCGVAEAAADPALDAGCQEAALLMLARREQMGYWDLSHVPPSDWPCWTSAGALSAARSNLAANPGPVAVEQFIDSHAHRGWVLNARTQTFGIGSCWLLEYGGANALDVFGQAASGPWPVEFVAFPPPGFMPRPLIRQEWTFAVEGADFTGATASVQAAGLPVAATVTGPFFYGAAYIVIQPQIVLSGQGPDVQIDVSVQNVVVGGSPTNFAYSFTAFGPDPPPSAAEHWAGYE